MTEDEAKSLRCCGPAGCGTLINPHVEKFPKELLALVATEFGSPRWCIASKCMAWEPEYMNEDRDINNDKEIPEGWHEVARFGTTKTIRRYYKIDKGDCGLKTKENGCFYPG